MLILKIKLYKNIILIYIELKIFLKNNIHHITKYTLTLSSLIVKFKI